MMAKTSAVALSNKTYDRTKWTTTIVLPAAAALYFGLAQIWGLPKAEEIVGSVAVVTTFLGVVLGISSKNYNDESALDGYILAKSHDPDTGLPNLQMVLNKMPDELMEKKTVRLKVDGEDENGPRG